MNAKIQISKALEAQNRAVDAHAMEACRLKMVPWWVYRPVVADSDHFEEEIDPDPNYSERRIRIRIKVMRFRNPGVTF
jgi:hypothetical protein